MNEQLAKLLASIQKRAFSGGGIGTAAGYVLTVVGAAETEGFCRQFPGKSADDFRAMLKAASEKLVHRPDVREPITAITKKKRGKNASGEIVSFGAPKRKDANTLTKSSVMDFENILTTKEKDRDGDILHPKGGKIDPAAPLLWQHIPTEPIGKLVQVVEQDDDHIKTHCAIADTPLGADAAALVEFGALRISHGFKPTKWKALSEGDESGGMITGYEIEEWEGMEISLVSVPANIGAVITAFSRQKLHSPLIKSWAGKLYDDRPRIVRTGFGVNWKSGKASGVTVNVNMPAAAAASTPAEPVKGSTKPPDDPKKKGKKAPEQEEDDADTEDPKQDTSENDDDKGEAAGNLLSDVAQRAADMADDESLSNEVRARCNVVAGILNDVGTDITAAMEKIQQCAESQDLAGLAAAHQEMIAGCGKRLQRAAAELASLVQASDDMDDGASGAVQEMAESIGAALSGIMPGQDEDPAEGGTGDWTETGNGPGGKDDDDKDEDDEDEEEKDDDDTGDDDEDEEEKDDADEEEDDEDSEDEDQKDDEDDDAEEKDDDADDDADEEKDDSEDDDDDDSELEEEDEKDDDEDDRDEKEEGDDEIDPDEENPGTRGQPNPEAGKADGDNEREDDDEDEDSKEADDDDEEEKDADDSELDDEPAKKPKKKPKAASLTDTAKKLTAAVIEGQPFKLKEHRDFAAAVVAGGKIDSEALVMYREVVGPLLGQKKKK